MVILVQSPGRRYIGRKLLHLKIPGGGIINKSRIVVRGVRENVVHSFELEGSEGINDDRGEPRVSWCSLRLVGKGWRVKKEIVVRRQGDNCRNITMAT